MGPQSLKAWLAPALMALVLVGMVAYNVVASSRRLPPGPLNQFQLQELTDRLDAIKARANSDAALSEPERAAADAAYLFGQFKKGGFRQVLLNDPERALRLRTSLEPVDPETARILVQALAVVQPSLSPDPKMAETQVKALPPDAFQAANAAYDEHLSAFARSLLEFCQQHRLPPDFKS